MLRDTNDITPHQFCGSALPSCSSSCWESTPSRKKLLYPMYATAIACSFFLHRSIHKALDGVDGAPMMDLGSPLRRWIAQSGADESVTWLAQLGQDPYRGEGRGVSLVTSGW
ncbi:hypothetical protein NW765_001854 [Fusarium oxysporum]|nr:hypothetical protein NW765_001854 [Fusarium oxysporum]KAJ4283991.1 hypothetical protein NW764_001548 [Fusarium oxysporum]